jgi:hypothetical protein
MQADFSAMHSNNNVPTVSTSEEQRKIEQQKQLEALRKRLLAKRGGSARPDTPQKIPVKLNSQMQQHRMEQQENKAAANGADQHINDDFGIESLLAEGKAAAEAKVARDNQAAAAATAATVDPIPSTIIRYPLAAAAPSNMEVEEVMPDSTRQKPAEPTQSVVSSPQNPADPKQTNTVSNTHPVNMSDPYYDDLSIWLEFTGYHDFQFRNSKLSTYKQRRELEQEAARIAQKLEALRQAERADLESLRATTAHQNTATQMAPPPLPSHMPTGDHRNPANGVKRPHSPEQSTAEKSRRKANESASDFRIRGANEAGTASSNGSPVHRRDSLPERRRSLDERHHPERMGSAETLSGLHPATDLPLSTPASASATADPASVQSTESIVPMAQLMATTALTFAKAVSQTLVTIIDFCFGFSQHCTCTASAAIGPVEMREKWTGTSIDTPREALISFH